MGINIPTKQELVANQWTVAEIGAMLRVDSLAYLSVEILYKAVRNDTKSIDESSSSYGYCAACFTGKYPIPPDW
jgi:amidophosphoribosyltransferase